MDQGSERIVVGVDGSPSSRQALRWAARQAKVTGASLEIVTCWEFPITSDWRMPPSPIAADLEHKAHRHLKEPVFEVLGDDPGIDVTITAVEGHPAPVLIDAARGASLLVIGSRGHGAFAGMFIGSVSNHCVSHAPCPVTVVRDAGE